MLVSVYNNSGSIIYQGQVVRQTGFIYPQNLVTIALASAASSATSTVFGIANQNINNNSTGSVAVTGVFSPINTVGFSSGATVYLSDTSGLISATPGTVSSVVGTAAIISVIGSINIRCAPSDCCEPVCCPTQGTTGIQGATGVGSGGGGGGATGLTGNTGIQGFTGLSGGGATGIQGVTGILGIDGVTGIQGVTGILGINGATGIQGVTGILGINGATGIQGLTGLAGVTGIQGLTGLGGITGIQTALSTYRYSINNGVPAGGTRFLSTFQTVATSSVGDRVIRNSTLIGISVQVNAIDAARSYTIDILSPPTGAPVIIASLSLPVSTIGAQTSSLSVPITAGSEIGAQMVRTSGAGASTFTNVNVSILLE